MRLIIRVFVPLLLLATGVVVGCATNGAGNGTGGTGGAGGTGGTAGTGGGPIVFCEPTTDRCFNATTGYHSPCCEQPVPEQANACDGTESLENPATCTVLDNAVTYKLTFMEVEGDCNVGYDLDACNGTSCFPGRLAPAEGIGGVDNALAAIAHALELEGGGGTLGDVNQFFSDALCGATDDTEMGTCEGDDEACTDGEDCPGGRCRLDDGDCRANIPAADIRFVVDANASENCANVRIISSNESSDATLNLSDDGCASGTLGTIPLMIGGIDGSLANAVVRMTISDRGFSDGLLGATIDESTAVPIFEAWLEGFGAVVARTVEINAATPPTRDISAECNALSATFVIGGIPQ